MDKLSVKITKDKNNSIVVKGNGNLNDLITMTILTFARACIEMAVPEDEVAALVKTAFAKALETRKKS